VSSFNQTSTQLCSKRAAVSGVSHCPRSRSRSQERRRNRSRSQERERRRQRSRSRQRREVDRFVPSAGEDTMPSSLSTHSKPRCNAAGVGRPPGGTAVGIAAASGGSLTREAVEEIAAEAEGRRLSGMAACSHLSGVRGRAARSGSSRERRHRCREGRVPASRHVAVRCRCRCGSAVVY
jgi:hypothetical protein